MNQGFSAYVYVRNTAMNAIVSMEKERFVDYMDILERKIALEKEYGQIGCHEVKMLIETFPNPQEDDLEEEFDSDEMEEGE
jgi:hypothetical protein